jgi:thioredoxin reductase (NADPH)
LVVGGGDSALEESLYLSRFADSVRVVHRRDELRGGQNLQQRAFANEKVDFVWSTVVESIEGDEKVATVKTKRTDTGEEGTLEATGVFIFIGHDPNSGFLGNAVETDDHGYIAVDERLQTSAKGVFAAGEIMDPVWRQVATSVGQGCMAGMSAVHYLDQLD